MEKNDQFTYLKKTLSHNEFNVLISVFINEMQECQNSVLYAMEKQDYTNVYKTCHKIYAGALTFGLDDLATESERINHALEFTQEVDEQSIQALLDLLKESVDSVEQSKIMSKKDE